MNNHKLNSVCISYEYKGRVYTRNNVPIKKSAKSILEILDKGSEVKCIDITTDETQIEGYDKRNFDLTHTIDAQSIGTIIAWGVMDSFKDIGWFSIITEYQGEERMCHSFYVHNRDKVINLFSIYETIFYFYHDTEYTECMSIRPDNICDINTFLETELKEIELYRNAFHDDVFNLSGINAYEKFKEEHKEDLDKLKIFKCFPEYNQGYYYYYSDFDYRFYFYYYSCKYKLHIDPLLIKCVGDLKKYIEFLNTSRSDEGLPEYKQELSDYLASFGPMVSPDTPLDKEILSIEYIEYLLARDYNGSGFIDERTIKSIALK